MPVFDYSWARPDPSLLDEGVMRYLAPVGAPWPNKSVGKIIGLDELNALWAAGKKVGLVWEVDTNDADGGYDHGKDSGEHARAMARTLGYPDTIPIYVAVDKRLTDANRGTAVEYVSGFRDGAGLARPYGEAALIDACVAAGISDCGWMPETWGRSPNLALIQRVGTSPVDGTDANSVVRPDWGGWNPADQPAPPPPPPPIPEELPNMAATLQYENQLHAWHVDSAGDLLHRWYDGSWHVEQLAQNCAKSAGVRVEEDFGSLKGRLDVFAEGTDNGLVHSWFLPAAGGGKWDSEVLA